MSNVCELCLAETTTSSMILEEDMFGPERAEVCAACREHIEAEESAYLAATDVEDRAGHFVVAGCFNYDDGVGFRRGFTSYRDAEAFLRKMRKKAARRGGIYPPAADEVEEVTEAEMASRASAWAQEAQEAKEFEARQDAEMLRREQEEEEDDGSFVFVDE